VCTIIPWYFRCAGCDRGLMRIIYSLPLFPSYIFDLGREGPVKGVASYDTHQSNSTWTVSTEMSMQFTVGVCLYEVFPFNWEWWKGTKQWMSFVHKQPIVCSRKLCDSRHNNLHWDVKIRRGETVLGVAFKV